MKSDTLYLDLQNRRSPTGHGHMFSNATQTVLLVASYCSKLDINLCFVSRDNNCEKVDNLHSITEGFLIPENCFNKVETKHISSIPKYVVDCSFPVIYLHSQTYLVSGLCHVIRQLVKLACVSHNQSLKFLLGHKQCCLKASSEISSRTRLCEALAPFVIDEWYSDSGRFGETPKPIKDLEHVFAQPVVIHNMDKCQRVVLDKLKRKAHDTEQPEPTNKSKRSSRKEVVATQDLPPLEHVFVEGVEFALSDLALLPMVHAFLLANKSNLKIVYDEIRLIMTWYERLQSIKPLTLAVKQCGVQFIPFGTFINSSSNKLEAAKCQILQLATNTPKHCKKEKKLLEKTIRRDLPNILEKVENSMPLDFLEFKTNELFVDWKKIPRDVHPTTGELTELRAIRKCRQIENILQAVKLIAKPDSKIVDFCCGGGHVGIALAYFLPHSQVVLIDNKEESLDRARARIISLNLSNVMTYQCNLEHFKGNFDIGVALHACGVATDMVLNKCYSQNASFVVSPCCYGRIQNTDNISYPQSKAFVNIPANFDEMLVLGRGGDQTTWNFDSIKALQGKRCMGIVDTDRLLAAQSRGYKTKLYTMHPLNCSPKNNLLIGMR